MSGPNRTYTRIEPVSWLEIAEMPEGGYSVYELDHHADRRKPIYSCSKLDELFEYLKVKLTLKDQLKKEPN